MHKVSKAPLLIVFAALLTASGPSWTSKPPGQWNEADAEQILTDSPWVRKATPAEPAAERECCPPKRPEWAPDKALTSRSVQHVRSYRHWR